MLRRLDFVFASKHGSLVEFDRRVFRQMTWQTLRGIRVATKQKLIDRIYKYLEGINETPAVQK